MGRHSSLVQVVGSVAVVVVGLALCFPPMGVGGLDPNVCSPKPGQTSLCDKILVCEEQGLSPIPTVMCGEARAFVDPRYRCNCERLCVDNIDAGEPCETSYPSDYPAALCSPGFDCLIDSKDELKFYCQRNPTKACVQLAIQYEAEEAEGVLSPGRLRPNCGDEGRFDTSQCSSSSTCYCTNAEGKRLFGEAIYTHTNDINCACALHWERNAELGLTQGMRCLPSGDIDPLQCNDDFCFCYSHTINMITSGPYHPTDMKQLDCYDPSYHQENFTNPCQRAALRYQQNNPSDGTLITVNTARKAPCGLDGHYASIQQYDTDYYCSDKHGHQIEDFVFPLAVLEISTCHCATRRHLMKESNLTSFLPKCCQNGNFWPYQVRGLYSFCVDGNGDQVGDARPATDVDSLDCTMECPKW